MKAGEPEWEPDYMTEDPTSAEQTAPSEEVPVYSDDPVTQLPEELEKPIDDLLGELSEFPEKLQKNWKAGGGGVIWKNFFETVFERYYSNL